MTDWKPNPGYMDFPPDTLIYGRAEGETRQEAIDWGPTEAKFWTWSEKVTHPLIEYKVVITPEEALRMIIDRGAREPNSAWAVEIAKED